MNDDCDAISNRGVLHAEASANTHSMNNATSPVPHKPMSPVDTQITQLPQPLSLQIDGSNAVTVARGDGNPNPAYIESSERGSDTSGDGRRLDLSAGTITDSLSSLPSSSTNGHSQSTEFGNSHTLNGHTSRPWVDRELLESQPVSHMQPVNGGASIDRWQPSLSPIKAGNVAISPPPSPKHSRTRSNFDARLAPGQKRTAAGDFKSPLNPPTPHSADSDGPARRRSKSTGSSAYGSRIAQLSVHIRTRLSYAAAKVEQARQSREATPQIALRTHNSAPLSPSAPSDGASLPAGNSGRFSPDSQTSSNGNSHQFPGHNRSRSALSSNQFLSIPKLAPPVDIISSNGHNQRRRPNPNAVTKPSDHTPISRHRRHHSYQENALIRPLNGQALLGPEKPSLSSSYASAPTSTPNGFYRPRTHSENTLMEQDAIETLMFMSSPENSGYRFSPRPLQAASTQNSLNVSINASSNETHHSETQGSQTSESHNGRGPERKPELEAHAGDDIDRLLDQMDSDSEDEGRYASYRLGINGAHPFREHQRPR
ncbi:uncharacterized protein N7500_005904 [Penicillium coprophilum]|uniref:uncharacterized protein n=1 Tax=Penicillium coprophilum TaxID=36646 RepID=UPI0023A0F44C|nr:uncharacterized protein N7500_005904 [Penicillium coprophilum]KAJ5164074.1 hypothetical protein N7500_005904 [Penicillium coprophilum]